LGTWRTWWEHFENLIRTQLRILGTWWEHLENLIRTQLRTWGTYWEHFENLMGTHWEQTENNPTWNPFWLSETTFSAAAERERERTWVFEKTWGCWREKRGEHGPWVLMIEWDSEREHGCVPTCYKPWQIERDYGRFFIVGRLVLSVFWGAGVGGQKRKSSPRIEFFCLGISHQKKLLVPIS
jgi:hypothetical protein